MKLFILFILCSIINIGCVYTRNYHCADSCSHDNVVKKQNCYRSCHDPDPMFYDDFPHR